MVYNSQLLDHKRCFLSFSRSSTTLLFVSGLLYICSSHFIPVKNQNAYKFHTEVLDRNQLCSLSKEINSAEGPPVSITVNHHENTYELEALFAETKLIIFPRQSVNLDRLQYVECDISSPLYYGLML